MVWQDISLANGWILVSKLYREEMQKLAATKVRNIGVSNFGIAHLRRLLSHSSCKIVPAVNQVEVRSPPDTCCSRIDLLTT